ncbi:MAG: nuclear transport factor 2 family protein [Pseudomonadota bacterium]
MIHKILSSFMMMMYITTVSAGDSSTAADTEAACLKTAHAYFIGVDNNDGQAVAELFTEDATLQLQQAIKGRQAIQKRFNRPTPNTKLFHHLTTHQIRQTDEGHATGSIYLLLNIATTPEDSDKPQTRLLSGVYHDEYVITDGVCRIKNRRLEIKMVN